MTRKFSEDHVFTKTRSTKLKSSNTRKSFYKICLICFRYLGLAPQGPQKSDRYIEIEVRAAFWSGRCLISLIVKQAKQVQDNPAWVIADLAKTPYGLNRSPCLIPAGVRADAFRPRTVTAQDPVVAFPTRLKPPRTRPDPLPALLVTRQMGARDCRGIRVMLLAGARDNKIGRDGGGNDRARAQANRATAGVENLPAGGDGGERSIRHLGEGGRLPSAANIPS